MKNKWIKQDLIDIIKKCYTKLEVLKNLGLKPFTGNYDTLNRYIKEYDIDISHFFRHSSNLSKKIPLEKILIKNSKYTNRCHLKIRLYKEGLKERKCEKCGQGEEWNGEKISLILDHINGINDDNRIENLRILCPNCNATLDTHCGKNIKKKREIKKKIERKKYYCNICGEEIRKNKNMKCIKCFNICNRKIERPDIEILLKEVKKLGYTGTGRKYGVSDNAIRKWIKYYEKEVAQ
jgi:hypothetical protein